MSSFLNASVRFFLPVPEGKHSAGNVRPGKDELIKTGLKDD
jgi:hypothetical protein